MAEQGQRYFCFGPFRLNVEERVLFRGSEPVALSPKALDMLAVLVRRSGHVVGKEELLKAVWPDTFVEEGNLSQHVFQLRKALGERQDGAAYIETVPRRGYRFTAEVRETAIHDASFRRRIALPAIVALGLLLALALWLGLRPGGRPPAYSIAVLPFLNLSPEPDNEYLSDALTEELITALSKFENLKVAARTSVFQFKGKAEDIRGIGRQLGADVVIEGSVRKEKGKLRVTTQLIKVADGYHLWSQAYDRNAEDVFSVQEDVCRDILTALKIRLPDQPDRRLVKRYTDNLEAYTLYWKGRYQWNRRSLEGVRNGMNYFQQVVGKDPRYALAYAGIADCFGLLGGYNVVAPADSFPSAKEAALKAISLDDTLAEAHASLGSVRASYEWDWAGAEREYRRAIQLNPSYATAHQWYAEHLAAMGRHAEARMEIRLALELEPLSPTINYVAAFLLFLARDYDGCIRQSRKTMEIEPAFPVTPFVLGYAYEQKGMYAEAEAEFREGMKLTGGFGARYLGHLFGLAGRRTEAIRVLGELQRRSRTDYVSPYDFALVFIGLGDRNLAFQWLDRACEARTNWLTHLKVDPRFDPLRSDPRFAALVKRVGLP